ncbi:hypothetical protein ACFWYW_46845 [Nonomuraea sp. NPDC059023]|uniref:hypothetical protein n=1 Tax=unclassified Nonomuraea TaxID=2593643 RepID=UPI0036A01C96
MTGTGIRPLPRPIDLEHEHSWWTYPTPGRPAPTAHAHLTVWRALHARGREGYLAVVTETGTGLSITNGIEHIWAQLHRAYPGNPVTLLEHYPADLGMISEEHFDEAWIPDERGEPRWRRIWPTASANDNHDLLGAWWDEHGPRLLNTVHRPHGAAPDDRA